MASKNVDRYERRVLKFVNGLLPTFTYKRKTYMVLGKYDWRVSGPWVDVYSNRFGEPRFVRAGKLEFQIEEVVK